VVSKQDVLCGKYLHDGLMILGSFERYVEDGLILEYGGKVISNFS